MQRAAFKCPGTQRGELKEERGIRARLGLEAPWNVIEDCGRELGRYEERGDASVRPTLTKTKHKRGEIERSLKLVLIDLIDLSCGHEQETPDCFLLAKGIIRAQGCSIQVQSWGKMLNPNCMFTARGLRTMAELLFLLLLCAILICALSTPLFVPDWIHTVHACLD